MKAETKMRGWSQILPLLFLTVLLTGSVRTDSIKYTDCGSTAKVTDFRVSGCSNPPCVFIKGNSYDIEIDATSRSASKALPFKVTARVDWIPITIEKGDACKGLTKGACPVTPGEEVVFKNTIKVLSRYPSLHTKVRVLVQDDQKQAVICAVLDVAIRKASYSSKYKRLQYFYNKIME